jgi:hypothetical protein
MVEKMLLAFNTAFNSLKPVSRNEAMHAALDVVLAHYADVFALLKSVPLPPSAITWEHGVDLLNALQAAAMKGSRP